jgi:hypothetical protein
LFVDLAVFHYELEQQANVGQGVAGYGDDIGVLSGLIEPNSWE